MFHKIVEIEAKDDFILIAKLQNGIKKKYDMKQLIDKYEIFKNLKENRLFYLVKVDVGGYGIFWNDDIDLSSEDIWENGIQIQ